MSSKIKIIKRTECGGKIRGTFLTRFMKERRSCDLVLKCVVLRVGMAT